MNQNDNKNISQKELCNLASEIWKLEKRIKKNESITSEDKKSYDFLFDRIYSIIKWNDVEILDYTWKKYIAWMNWFDIVWSEHDWSLSHDIIWESITPMIKIDWKIIQKSKVMIKTPDELEEDEEKKGKDKCKKSDNSKRYIILWSLFVLILLFIIWLIFSWSIDNLFLKIFCK